MASINYAARQISVKIVYYGPGLSGKTTNLQVIHKKTPQDHKSDMVSLATETDRTLFFDFLPLDLGKIKGFATKFQLYTVPGQVYYNATRKLVLRGVDGVVFVADSGADKIQENLESFQNLEDNLAEYGYQRESIPIIIQYNKRDLPNALPVEELNRHINKYNLPYGEGIAYKGVGVFDTLKQIGKIVIDYLNKKYSRSAPGKSAAPADHQLAQTLPPAQQFAPPPPPPPVPQYAPGQTGQFAGYQPPPPAQHFAPPPPPPAQQYVPGQTGQFAGYQPPPPAQQFAPPPSFEPATPSFEMAAPPPPAQQFAPPPSFEPTTPSFEMAAPPPPPPAQQFAPPPSFEPTTPSFEMAAPPPSFEPAAPTFEMAAPPPPPPQFGGSNPFAPQQFVPPPPPPQSFEPPSFEMAPRPSFEPAAPYAQQPSPWANQHANPFAPAPATPNFEKAPPPQQSINYDDMFMADPHQAPPAQGNPPAGSQKGFGQSPFDFEMAPPPPSSHIDAQQTGTPGGFSAMDFPPPPPAGQNSDFDFAPALPADAAAHDGKSELDIEIEKYQREIEEKQKKMRAGAGAFSPPPAPSDVHEMMPYPGADSHSNNFRSPVEPDTAVVPTPQQQAGAPYQYSPQPFAQQIQPQAQQPLPFAPQAQQQPYTQPQPFAPQAQQLQQYAPQQYEPMQQHHSSFYEFEAELESNGKQAQSAAVTTHEEYRTNDSAMFFTSVDRNHVKQKKPLKPPVNPKLKAQQQQQHKGIMSQLFKKPGQ